MKSNICIIILLIGMAFYQHAIGNDTVASVNIPPISRGWNSLNQQLIASVGPTYLTIDHPQTSPLVKTGIGARLDLAYLIKAHKFFASVNLQFSGVPTGDNTTNEIESADYHIIPRIIFSGGYKLSRKIEKFDVYLGGAMSMNEHIYYFTKSFNAGFQYLNTWQLGGNLYAERPVSFHIRNPRNYTPFYISYNLSLPLIALVSTPPYNGFYDFVIPERTDMDDMVTEAKAIGNFLVIDSRINFDWYMRNSNALRLSYNWIFNRYNVHSGSINMASHTIEFSFLMKLDRNSSTTRLKNYGY